MLCRETIAVCSQIHTKKINTLYRQNVEFEKVKLVLYILTTVRYIYRPLCRIYTKQWARKG